jgi:hypothetical protein
MRRLRGEDGFTLVPAIVTLSIVLAVGGASLAMAWRSLGSSTRDRSAARALAAADAGADVAGYRLNRTLVSAGSAGLLGFTTDALRTVGCIKVQVGGAVAIDTSSVSAGFCGQTTDEDLADGSKFHYVMSTGIKLGASVSEILTRRVIATGISAGVTRRVLVTYKLELNASNPLRLFKRYRYAICSAVAPTSDPASGCPDPGT